MQSELPWNVAGIPPEAREAARAAARREGLSVGEWMTRRIMRGFPDAANEDQNQWRRPSVVESFPAQERDPHHTPHESQEMLARISRSESEAQNAYAGLDQQLRSMTRRLETAERNQTENNRAMTQAATQINIAAREQAQAFEQMTANVASLADRLARVERHAQTDSTRDAVKALHEGLSRVADQIAQTANQSAAQIAALAGNVDSLATQLAETRQAAEAGAQALESRFASVDERLRVVERSAFSNASALDHTMENVEALRAMKQSIEAELRQQATAVAQARDAFEQFSAHSSIAENTRAGAIARLEERVADLQAQHSENPLDRRLEGIEHVLADIMGRLEQTERTSAGTSGNVEQMLRELALGFETADCRTRETVRELQAAVGDTAVKIAAVEEKLIARIEAVVEPKVAPVSNPAPQPIFDMPVFPDFPSEQQPADAMPPEEAFASASSDHHFAPPPFASTEAESGMNAEPPAGPHLSGHGPTESFIAAARRSAKAAAAEVEHARPQAGGLGWTVRGRSPGQQPPQQGKRYLLAGSIFGIAVAGALAGVVLTHGMGSTEPHAVSRAVVSRLVSHPSTPAPAQAPQSPQPHQGEESTAKIGQEDRLSAAPAAPVTSSKPAQQQSGATGLPRLAAPARTQTTAGPATTKGPSNGTASANSLAVQSPQPTELQRLISLARNGGSKGQLLLGLRYLDGNGVAVNEAEAARWLARAAQQGEPLAQYRLGTLYERGRGVPADNKQAAHWYDLAAKQGNRKAMHNLAVAFAEGSGEPKDPAQAALWFARAANLGLADSQFNLAVLYERGMGVKQSLADAYKWYLIAAAAGDAESKARAEALATQLSEADRAAAQQAAASFKPQPLNPAANSVPAFG